MALDRTYQELQFQDPHVYSDLNNRQLKVLDEPVSQGNYQNLQFQDHQTSMNAVRSLRRSEKGLRRWRATAILSLTLSLVATGLLVASVLRNVLHKLPSCSSNKTCHSLLQQLKAAVCTSPGRICEYCARNWQYHNGSCYFFHFVPTDWSSSKQRCEQMGAHLPVINDEEEERFLEDHGAAGFWIGLSKNEVGIWTWVDGTTLANKTSFWNKNQPDNKGGTEECVLIFKKAVDHRGWNDDSCNKEKPGVCEQGSIIYHDEEAPAESGMGARASVFL
ncbi:CD209 antigen-like protein E [Microcaecilia unicolor]|uniref:CD209 antigen-like protein E n=1 Tax=Microcaecilia unicolor TaxID=1415580 RepID=A0A6P7XS78_9AMPH|nr:CD209 antigen-like protein E [Microcaecilia unicolor]